MVTGTPTKSRYFWKVLAQTNKVAFLKALERLVSTPSLLRSEVLVVKSYGRLKLGGCGKSPNFWSICSDYVSISLQAGLRLRRHSIISLRKFHGDTNEHLNL